MSGHKLVCLALLIVLALALTGHATRRATVFPVEVRQYITYSTPILVPPPISATATGIEGQMAFDSKYVYFCYDTDSWKRIEMSTWTESYLLMPTGDKVLMPTGDFIVLP